MGSAPNRVPKGMTTVLARTAPVGPVCTVARVAVAPNVSGAVKVTDSPDSKPVALIVTLPPGGTREVLTDTWGAEGLACTVNWSMALPGVEEKAVPSATPFDPTAVADTANAPPRSGMGTASD